MPWYLLALLSAISASSASFVEKSALTTMRSFAFSLRVSYLVALISIPILFLADFSAFGIREYVLTALFSACGALAYLRITHGIRRLDVGEFAPLLLISPAITACIAFIVLGEGLTRFDVAGMIILMYGAYKLEAQKDGIRGILRRLADDSGLRYILQGVLLYSITAVFDRSMLGGVGVPIESYLALAQIYTACAMTLFAIGSGKGKHIISALSLPHSCGVGDTTCEVRESASKHEWFATLFITMATLANRFFFFQAVALAPIGPTTALRRTSAFFSAFFDTSNKALRSRRIIACTIMLAGVLLIVLR